MQWTLEPRPELLRSPDLQSALVRMGIWLFGLVYIGLSAYTGYSEIDVAHFLGLFSALFAVGLALLFGALRWPNSKLRRYASLTVDIVAASLVIQLTREAVSPFYLFYIWIFISAGTRYGRSPLIFASALSVLAYSAVLLSLDHWARHPFEATFFLLLLVALPAYQYALLSKIQQARAEAERANRAKGDFLAVMTHELRTPLTGVIGMSDLLATTELTAEQREYVQAITRSAELLGSLIGDILDLSRIDAKRLQLEDAPFDLRATAKEVCALLAPRAVDKGLELILRVDPRLSAQYLGDSLRVRQILLNLIGNAVKFTEQGEIALDLTARPTEGPLIVPHVLIEVHDTGIGIPTGKLATVFESFRQADESTTRRFGGSGLGTTIARDLTQLMGGAIGVDSEVGRGSRFWVRLPLAEAPGGADGPPPPSRFPGRLVLLCEPNASYQRLVSDLLMSAGARCWTIPEIAMHSDASDEPFDLLIVADAPHALDMDPLLPLIRQLRDRDTPCLCLTYAGRCAEQRGPFCSSQLQKPFLPAELLEAVAALLGTASMSRTEHLVEEAPPAALAASEGAGREAGRVLIAEDNEIAAKVITTFLARLGCSVVRVGDGEAALRAATSERFDMAFVDLRMPKLDGITFTEKYRVGEVDGRLPIIALTANAAKDVQAACLKAGMDDFLSKPVKLETLHQMVRRYGPAAAANRKEPANRNLAVAVDHPSERA